MKVGYTTGIRGMEIRYGPWEDQVKPSGDHIPGNTVVNETFDPMYEPSLLLSYLTWAVKTICSRRLANLTINFVCAKRPAASEPPLKLQLPAAHRHISSKFRIRDAHRLACGGGKRSIGAKHWHVHCTCTLHPSSLSHTAPSRPCQGAPMYRVWCP